MDKSKQGKNMWSFHLKKMNNKGLSLMEVIIAIAIMAVLTGIIVPQYIKYVNRSKKVMDINNAEAIAKAFEMALIEYPEAYEAWQKGSGVYRSVSVTENGTTKRYRTEIIMTNEPNERDHYAFGGTVRTFGWNGRSYDKGLYTYVNDALGISTSYATSRNKATIAPQYKIKVPSDPRRGYVDRWRICKSPDGQLEVWTAENSIKGDGGGSPIYRLWPVPCDEYAK